MPRNGSGIYSLPAGNPVVSGTVIDVNWANPTMNDIVVQLNNVLTRDGLLGPTSPLLTVDGSVTLPGYGFSAQSGTGVWRDSNGLNFTLSGVNKGLFDSLGLSVVGRVTNSMVGLGNAVSYNSISNSNTGTLVDVGVSLTAGSATGRFGVFGSGATTINGLIAGSLYAYTSNTAGFVFQNDSAASSLFKLFNSSVQVASFGAPSVGHVFTTSGTSNVLTLTDTGANGANLKFIGNGATTPNKTIRVAAGVLQVLDSAYGSIVFGMNDTGSVGIPSLQKLYLDGSSLGGNSYIWESAGDQIDIVAGGVITLRVNTTSASLTATPAFADNSLKVATTAYVDRAMPAGVILDFGGSTAPTGYIACGLAAGATASRTTYAALFAAIGTTWGAGDGSTTFGLPWFAAGYAAVMRNATVGVYTTGSVIAHLHGQGATLGGTGLGGNGGAWVSSASNTTSTGGTDNLAAGNTVLKIIKT